MEFNEQFYNRLFKLVHLKKETRLIETRKIVQEVTAHYLANGITEIWQNLPGDEPVPIKLDPTSEAVVRRFEKEKPMAPAPLKKDFLATDVHGIQQQLAKASPARLTASPNVYHYSTNSDKRNSNSNEAPDSSTTDSVSDADSNRTLQVMKSETEPDSSITSTNIILNESNNTNSIVLPNPVAMGLKRSHSEDESSVSINEPPIKQRKHDDQIRVPNTKMNNKELSASTGHIPVEEVFDEGLYCVVCKQLSNPIGNRVLQCHECHNLYHQKCHEPNIPQSQIDDPRLLWYCNTCSKKMKKLTSSISKPANQTVQSKVPKETAKEKPKAVIDQSVKRSDSKEKSQPTSTIQQSTLQQKSLTAVAADFLAKHKNLSKTSAPPMKSISSTLPTTFGSTFSTSASSLPSGLVGLGKLAAAQQKLANSTPNLSGLGKLQQIAASSTKPSSSNPIVSQSTSSLPKTTTLKVSSSLIQASSLMQAAEKRLQQMKKKAQSKSFLK